MRPTREHERAAGVGRRLVLRTLGGSIALGSLATEAGGEADSDGDGEYAVVQGDECVPVVPLSGDQTVEELYDLRIPDRYAGDNGATDPGSGPYYQSNGTTDLQRENTTITFLYDGPDGLSLVVVHDSPDGADGGSVSWTLEDVPSDAAWVLKDDLYIDPDTGNENNFDQWTVDGSEHVVDWTWGSAGTDGGALGPLEDEFSIGLDPDFNEQSELWGEHYTEDPITDWQVLSFPDGREEPERASLTLDERVTIRAGACDEDDSAGKIADPDEDRDERDDDEKDRHEDKGEDTNEDEEEGVESDEKGEKKEEEGDEDRDDEGEDGKDEKDDDGDGDEGEDTDEDEEEKGEKDDDDEDEEEKGEKDDDDEDEEEKGEKDDDDEDEEEDDDEEEKGDEDEEEDDDEKERGRGNGRGNGRGDDGRGGNGNGHGGGTGRGNDR